MRKAISVYDDGLEIDTPDGEGRLVDVKFKVVVEYGQDERDRSYVEIADDPLTWNKEDFTPEENEAIAAQLTDRFVKSIEDRAIDKFQKRYSTFDRGGRRMVVDPDDYFEEVRRMQEIAGIKSSRLKEDDYDMGTPSGDTDAMNIAEDDFSGTMHAVEDDPVV